MFGAQLRYLRRQGFTGLTFGELCQRRRTGQPLPARPIVLTFDDGYADLIEEALPITDRARVPGDSVRHDGMVAWRGTVYGRDAHPAACCRGRSSRSFQPLASRSPRTVTVIPSSTRSPSTVASRARRLPSNCWKIASAAPCAASPTRTGTPASEYEPLRAKSATYRRPPSQTQQPPSTCDPFRVPRLTIRRSTSSAAFASTVNGKRIRLHYAPAHALTAGWAVVRRTRSVLRTLPRDLAHPPPAWKVSE